MNARSLMIVLISLILLIMAGLLFFPQSPWSVFHSSQSASQEPVNFDVTNQELTTTQDQDTPIAPEVLVSNWRTAVDDVLALYDKDRDAGRAKTALIILKVPADKREVHLHLVLALDQIIQKDPAGEEAFQKARAEYQAIR